MWLTVLREVEQIWQLFHASVGVPGIGKATVRVTKLVEEGMAHCLYGGETLGWGILEQSCDEVDGFGRRLPEYLIPHVSAVSFSGGEADSPC